MLVQLRKIINKKVILTIDQNQQQLNLKETDPHSKISELKITQVPSQALAFTLDFSTNKLVDRKFKQLSSYVEPTNGDGVNKGCDLIILWPRANRIKALVFDLKSDNPNRAATKKQLLNSALFLHYLLSLVKHHYQQNIDHVDIYQAIVTTSSRHIPRNITYSPNQKSNSAAEFAIHYVSEDKPQISLNKLIQHNSGQSQIN